MPLREFGCKDCQGIMEMYHPASDPARIIPPPCPKCDQPMALLISNVNLDTSTTFNRSGGGKFDYTGPTGLVHEIETLHQLRQVEHAYLESKHDVRFDAWSANENNPDPIDGFGPEYWSGQSKDTVADRPRRIFSKW